MKRHGRHTNELIARAVDRLLCCSKEAEDGRPAASAFAKEMCGIWLQGLWMLTQV